MKAVFLDSANLDELALDELARQCSSLRMYDTTAPEEVAERIAGAEAVILNKVRIARHPPRRRPLGTADLRCRHRHRCR